MMVMVVRALNALGYELEPAEEVSFAVIFRLRRLFFFIGLRVGDEGSDTTVPFV